MNLPPIAIKRHIVQTVCDSIGRSFDRLVSTVMYNKRKGRTLLREVGEGEDLSRHLADSEPGRIFLQVLEVLESVSGRRLRCHNCSRFPFLCLHRSQLGGDGGDDRTEAPLWKRNGAEPLEQANLFVVEVSLRPSPSGPELLGSSTDFPSCILFVRSLD